MSVEVDHTSQPRFQDGGSQVFWTIGSDHRLYRIELSHRGAKAVAAGSGPAGQRWQPPDRWPVADGRLRSISDYRTTAPPTYRPVGGLAGSNGATNK
jgi:hypothetical protein